MLLVLGFLALTYYRAKEGEGNGGGDGTNGQHHDTSTKKEGGEGVGVGVGEEEHGGMQHGVGREPLLGRGDTRQQLLVRADCSYGDTAFES